MAEITIVKPHDEGKSALEVTVNGEKWSITRGETADVPEYIATEVRRSLAQRDSLSLSDRDEREGEPEGGGGGGGSNVETATIVISVADGTPTITSGAFPEWCTEANNDYIYGEIVAENVTLGGVTGNGTFKVIEVSMGTTSDEVKGALGASGFFIFVAKDLSYVGGEEPATSGTITINLVYLPEE